MSMTKPPRSILGPHRRSANLLSKRDSLARYHFAPNPEFCKFTNTPPAAFFMPDAAHHAAKPGSPAIGTVEERSAARYMPFQVWCILYSTCKPWSRYWHGCRYDQSKCFVSSVQCRTMLPYAAWIAAIANCELWGLPMAMATHRHLPASRPEQVGNELN
jgi:hypothetical protein